MNSYCLDVNFSGSEIEYFFCYCRNYSIFLHIQIWSEWAHYKAIFNQIIGFEYIVARFMPGRNKKVIMSVEPFIITLDFLILWII